MRNDLGFSDRNINAARNGVAKVAGIVSDGMGRASSVATVVAVVSPELVSKATATVVAVTTGTIGGAAGAIEQLARPDLPKAIDNVIWLIAQKYIDEKAAVIAPITNEVIEAWKNSGTNQTVHDWTNEQLRNALEYLKGKK